jgi:hypothetical protein
VLDVVMPLRLQVPSGQKQASIHSCRLEKQTLSPNVACAPHLRTLSCRTSAPRDQIKPDRKELTKL